MSRLRWPNSRHSLSDVPGTVHEAPGRLATSAAFDTPGRAQGVAVNRDLAYVADGQAGLQVIDLSTPSAPRVVGGFETARPARDVAARDSLKTLR